MFTSEFQDWQEMIWLYQMASRIDESHQFVSEVLEIQDKFQHVCRIVSIRIRETCLAMFDESY